VTLVLLTSDQLSGIDWSRPKVGGAISLRLAVVSALTKRGTGSDAGLSARAHISETDGVDGSSSDSR
jgi:hypothetical protein